jgi:hypothetical protein
MMSTLIDKKAWMLTNSHISSPSFVSIYHIYDCFECFMYSHHKYDSHAFGYWNDPLECLLLVLIVV